MVRCTEQVKNEIVIVITNHLRYILFSNCTSMSLHLSIRTSGHVISIVQFRSSQFDFES